MQALLEGMRPSWVASKLKVSRQTVDAWRRGYNITPDRVAQVLELRAQPLAGESADRRALKLAEASLGVMEGRTPYEAEPVWVKRLLGQVLRNEAMLLVLQRKLDITADDWDAATQEIIQRSAWEGIEDVLGPLPSARGADPHAAGNGEDRTDSPGAGEPSTQQRPRSRQR